MPYHVLGSREGAAVVTISWIRLAMERSAAGISAIRSRSSRSMSAPCAAAFCSLR